MKRYGLGRIRVPDMRDGAFSMNLVLGIEPGISIVGRRLWELGPVIDQGASSTCVGQAWAGWLQAEPIRTGLRPWLNGWTIYDKAKALDGLPEGVQGSTVRAGVQVLRSSRRVYSFLWAENADQLKAWLLTKGTVVIGTDWYAGMMGTDAEGFVKPSGAVVGGHAYLARGYDSADDTVHLVNSWGKSWGQNGRFKMQGLELWSLVARGGEACAAVQQNPSIGR